MLINGTAKSPGRYHKKASQQPWLTLTGGSLTQVLRAAGGVLTDLHGCPIEHSPATPTVNRLGVLASAASFRTAR